MYQKYSSKSNSILNIQKHDRRKIPLSYEIPDNKVIDVYQNFLALSEKDAD